MDKANTFAEYLSSVFEPSTAESPEQDIPEVSLIKDNDTQENLSTKTVKMKEVHYFIKQLKDKKTPGYDNINSKIIKELPIKAIRFLTIIINAVFRLNHFPSQW